MALSDYPLEEFFSYIHNSKKYRIKLERSINSNLWEYATILVWKNTILFVYEKLFQKKILGHTLPKDFTQQLEKGNITIHNCFDFCCILDDNIYTHIHEIWFNLDKNYKQVFKGLLDDRNSLSHVNRYEDNFNEQWFRTYFEKALNLVKYLQELNDIQLSQKIYTSMDSEISVQYISERDVIYLFSRDEFDNSIIMTHLLDFVNVIDYSDTLKSRLKEEAIDVYLNSSSFASALANGKKLLKLADYFNEAEVRNILTRVFTQQRTPNQILGALEMESVFLELFEKSINLEGLELDWRLFVDKLIVFDTEKYNEVKDRLIEAYGDGNSETQTES